MALYLLDTNHLSAALDSRSTVRVLSQVDMLVVALALSMNATILTSDRDFGAIAALH
jgi:predicted nucleic acid-binding protein